MEYDPLDNLGDNGPRFDTGLGYVILLDSLIKYACGYLIIKDYESYYLTLESWYLEVHYRFSVSNKITTDEIKDLDNLRTSAEKQQPTVLKNYHKKLNELTNKAGLRLKDAQGLPGVLNG